MNKFSQCNNIKKTKILILDSQIICSVAYIKLICFGLERYFVALFFLIVESLKFNTHSSSEKTTRQIIVIGVYLNYVM